MFHKKNVLKSLANFEGKPLCRSFFPANFENLLRTFLQVISERLLLNMVCFFDIKHKKRKLTLTRFKPLDSFYIRWKHQKTCFSVFRGYGKRSVAWNGLRSFRCLSGYFKQHQPSLFIAILNKYFHPKTIQNQLQTYWNSIIIASFAKMTSLDLQVFLPSTLNKHFLPDTSLLNQNCLRKEPNQRYIQYINQMLLFVPLNMHSLVSS